MEDSVKRMFLKTRYNPYKGLQRNSIFRKTVYRYSETATAKMNSFAASSHKIRNFSNSYFIVHIFNGSFTYFTFYILWCDYLKALTFIEKLWAKSKTKAK